MDYPILSAAPETSFSCSGRPAGLYADVEARCQAWHQCLGDRGWSFLCPNGTIFNQQIFTCVWWFDFDCQQAEGLYGLNEGLYESEGGEEGAGGEEEEGQSNSGEIVRPSSGDSTESEDEGSVAGEGPQPGPLLPVVSEGEEDLSGEEENNLSEYEENELSGYVEEVTVSGPTPSPAQPDGLYGAPRVGRRRKGRRYGRKIGRSGLLRRRRL